MLWVCSVTSEDLLRQPRSAQDWRAGLGWGMPRSLSRLARVCACLLPGAAGAQEE